MLGFFRHLGWAEQLLSGVVAILICHEFRTSPVGTGFASDSGAGAKFVSVSCKLFTVYCSFMELPKAYTPKDYETDIYALWEKGGAFTPKNKGGKGTYSIVMPPPNANGDLHLGHALTLALEDIAIRYNRMKGKATLFVPGADHAGFETQVVYEKELAKQGKSRFDFTREQLYQQVWDFVAKNKGNYELQFRRLGASVDWDHYVFTLDEKIVKTAYATFKKMFDEGLIYRGERLVNFCTFHGTGFADIEVQYQEVAGKLYYIRYPLVNGSGPAGIAGNSDGAREVVIATTRPETMLGDTAVAVHPNDQRYKDFIGKTVKLPLTHREIPIIADEFVDTGFGTGAVKITPAHDPNDYEAGKRHDLPFVTVIDHEGKMSAEAGDTYRGLSVEAARKQVVKDLEDQKFLVKTEDHTHSVGHCYKCDTVLQPLLREQWFIDMAPLTKPAIEALKAKKIAFYPDSKRTQLITYLEGLRDWNISRQIAWGIPIPAFQSADNPDDWIYDERIDQEFIEVEGKTYHRDADVFDTWFSSASWPYATLDYPDGKDFRQFYPLSVMETGADILYPWVSRMIMFGLYNTGEVPFKAVYLHGLILDEKGAKMSKSKGNVVNPMDVLEQYGSDALRLGLIQGQTPGNNQPFGTPKVVGGRNFCNKLWNVARFVEAKVGDDFTLKTNPSPKNAADHYILSNLQQLTELVGRYLEQYRFAEAYEAIYHFVWDEVADWYVEFSKAELNKGVLAYVLEAVLKVAHPFAPFVTETIWQTLKWEDGSLLATATWPEVTGADAKKGQAFEELKDIITEIRYISGVLNVYGLKLYFSDDSFIREHAALIKALAKVEVKQVSAGQGLHLTSTTHDAWLDLDQDSIKHFLQELQTKVQQTEQDIAKLETRLASDSYVKNAPKALVEETKSQLAEAKALRDKTQTEHDRFSGSDH